MALSKARIYFLSFFLLSFVARTEFVLLDRICVEIEGEPPILLSEIKRRAEQKGISIQDAQKDLIREQSLWIDAKKRINYDISQINKAADDHVKKVMADLKLSFDQFADLLMKPPYTMSVRQFKRETATLMLQNSFKATLASQIVVTDEQVVDEIKRRNENKQNQFDVVIIRILPQGVDARKNSVDSRFKKANEIRNKILSHLSLTELNESVKGQKNIVVMGPFGYEKGSLKSSYENHLAKNHEKLVSVPFVDNDEVILIWKIRPTSLNLNETALEKVRKELYEDLVMEKYQTVTEAMVNSSAVELKGCGKQ